jgi:hypothetical protein
MYLPTDTLQMLGQICQAQKDALEGDDGFLVWGVVWGRHSSRLKNEKYINALFKLVRYKPSPPTQKWRESAVSCDGRPPQASEMAFPELSV